MDLELKAEFNRLHKKLNELIKSTAIKKETWVTYPWIMEVTCWNKRKLQAAREQKIVEYKESGSGGYLYKLESIPEYFIKNKWR
jgi:hypothetical protein